ncbi:ABC transporter permease [Bacillus sp. CLL-7-23]|uniref:Nickel import system permease protein NikB n=1 Tax=Bacillus changyiensis TaxID=3004103 RepID=A0ABT4X481_9BACI|nr:nickel ABC transporter permease [Bacillus changyiensis]MDA7027069.1 ABC transporter permease [Bacillus changyiensis]
MKHMTKRLFELVLFLFLLSFISFIFMKAAPGDPVKQMLRVDDIAVTNDEIERFKEEIGFNKPVHLQYLDWLKQFFQFDFGHSYTTHKPVIDELSRTFPETLLLSMTSLIVMLLISVPIGTLSALYQDRWIDHIGRIFALIGASIPSFWLGLIFIDLFSVRLNWLPSMGSGTVWHLILPSLTLGIAMSGVYVRFVRSSLIESLGQDFIRSARARGISEFKIFWFHAFRHSLIPVITIFGVSLGSLLGGTVIIEVLFAYPGIGKLVVDAIIQRDYPIIQGYILLMGVTVVIINLLIDLSYQFLNPEIRLKEAERK